jgi:hypothetical protein
MEVFEVLFQPVQDVQHVNTVGDIDAEVSEGVGEALHLSTVVVDAEVTLNKAPESGIDVEGTGFTVAKEVVLQDQSGVASRVTTLLVTSYRLGEMVPWIHDLTTLSIQSQAGMPMCVVSIST